MKNHPTTHWVAVAFMAVAALSLCLEPAMAQTEDPDVHGSYGSTVERRIAQHDSWESAPQTRQVAQAPAQTQKEWTPSDAFGSTSDKPTTTDSGDWTPEKEFGNRALSPAEKELAGSSTGASGDAVFHGGYVYPPGTDTSKLASTPQKPTVAAKTPAPKPESKVAKSTPTWSTPPTPRHPERSEGSRSTRTASFPASDDTIPTTTEPKAAPSPSTSTEPVEPPLVDETPGEVEFDDESDSTTTTPSTGGWQLVASALNWCILAAIFVTMFCGALWVLFRVIGKESNELLAKTFKYALAASAVLWAITHFIQK